MALREALKDYEYNHSSNESETHENKSILLNVILKHLNLQSIYELVSWSFVASKAEVADLAHLIIKLSVAGNPIAKQVVDSAVEELVGDIKCLIRRLRCDNDVDDSAIQIGFTGGLLTRSEIFFRLVSQKLKECVQANIILLKDTVIGALKMIAKNRESKDSVHQNGSSINHMTNEQLSQMILPISTLLSLTEKRNEKSMKLDLMTIKEGIELMIEEESNNFREIRKNRR